MSASEHFEAGQLDEAIAAAIAEVKAKPTDIAARCFLAELSCFAGEFDRTDRQLDTLSTQDPEAAAGVAEFRQLVRAAIAREECFTQGRVPEFLEQPTPYQESQLKAIVALREGNAGEAATLLAEAEEARAELPGKRGETAFDDCRDLDDLLAGTLEVLSTTGKYFWIPFAKVNSITFAPPQYPRDLLWRRVELDVEGGPDGVVYVPVIYPGTAEESDTALRLGRATDWRGGDDSPVRGVGQKTWLVGDEDVPILELESLTFGE